MPNGTYPYREGYHDGWEAAANFVAEYMLDILDALTWDANNPDLGGYTYFTYHRVVVDDADQHLMKLKTWGGEVTGLDGMPPTPQRTLTIPRRMP